MTEEFVLSDNPWWRQWNPYNVTVFSPGEGNDSYSGPDEVWKTCVLQGVYFGKNQYNGWLGARISSIFVILFVSTAFTFFPIVSKKVSWLKVHKLVYLFARHMGTGVVVSTAFIHLLEPAYASIGAQSCVGMTGHWGVYTWCPAFVLAAVVATFLIDLFSSIYVERKYGLKKKSCCDDDEIQSIIVRRDEPADIEQNDIPMEPRDDAAKDIAEVATLDSSETGVDSIAAEMSFRSELGAFLIMEFGILFHSVMIGLNLGAVGEEFRTLYPVIVFHQSFEGLGIGARLSSIQFPKEKSWWPHVLCLAYGLITPISVAIGLGLRESWIGSSYGVLVVSGVLDAISSGILIWTGLVELLARDYLYSPNKTDDLRILAFNISSFLFGVGLMSLLGKWA